MILIVDPPKENRFNIIFLKKINGEKIKLSIWEILEYKHFFKSKSKDFGVKPTKCSNGAIE